MQTPRKTKITMFRSFVLVVPLSLMLGACRPTATDDPPVPAGDKDYELLQGEWVVAAYTVDGIRAPADVLKNAVVSFQERKFALKPMPVPSTDESDKDATWKAEQDFEATFELGKARGFQTVDLIVGDGKDVSRVKGIYALDGDELRMCFSLAKKVPTEFESKAGSKNRLLSLKRAKH